MPLNNVKVLQAAIRSFKATIDADPATSTTHVSIQLAEHYNALRAKAAAFPDLAGHLPPAIKTQSNLAALGKTASTFAELKVYINELHALAELLEA